MNTRSYIKGFVLTIITCIIGTSYSLAQTNASTIDENKPVKNEEVKKIQDDQKLSGITEAEKLEAQKVIAEREEHKLMKERELQTTEPVQEEKLIRKEIKTIRATKIEDSDTPTPIKKKN